MGRLVFESCIDDLIQVRSLGRITIEIKGFCQTELTTFDLFNDKQPIIELQDESSKYLTNTVETTRS